MSVNSWRDNAEPIRTDVIEEPEGQMCRKKTDYNQEQGAGVEKQPHGN